MGWFKKAGKTVKNWFSKTGKVAAREAEEAADFTKDIGENIGEFGREAVDKISEVAGNVKNIKLPALPPMPDIKGPKGKDLIEQKRAWIDRYISLFSRFKKFNFYRMGSYLKEYYWDRFDNTLYYL